VSKKKCDLWRLVQNCTFLCNSPAWCFFNIFLIICIFFGTPMVQKKIRESFFLSKLKVQKAFLHINYFYRNLKIYKEWGKESPKIAKRKFAIFSSGLSFNEKLFKFSSSFLLSIFWSIKYTLFSRNLKNHWKTIFPQK